MVKISNIRIIDVNKDFIGDIIFNKKILNVEKKATITTPIEIDGSEMYLFPGFVDPHVHFRTPGLEHKENFKTGGHAALAGGITVVFDMPNTIPAVTNSAALNEKRKIINKISPVFFGIFFCINDDNIEEIKKIKNVPGIKIFLNDTTGHLLLKNKKILSDIFKLKKRITLHAEGDTFLEAISIWESVGNPCQIHLAHMTLEQELKEIKRLKNQSALKNLISCEVCPHHLFFSKKDLEKFPLMRMKPELANESDRLSLWEGIETSFIDCFATDHAPHLIYEKQNTPPAFGVPGVETSFNLIFTEWIKRKWCLKKFSKMMTWNALNIYKVNNKKGLIDVNYDADFTIVNPNKNYTIKAEFLHSKCGWTPYENFQVCGKIESTFISGEKIYDGKSFNSCKIKNKELIFED